MDDRDVGVLLNSNNIKLRRFHFAQMCRLIGIKAIYRAPKEDKQWDGWGELDASFYPPETIACVFTEHPNQKTLKKLGWVAELQENNSIIEVPYDLKHLQVGALFIIPSGLDDSKGRVFKVVGMESVAVYPASILCEISPVYEDAFERKQLNHIDNDTNLLSDDSYDNDGSDFKFLR